MLSDKKYEELKNLSLNRSYKEYKEKLDIELRDIILTDNTELFVELDNYMCYIHYYNMGDSFWDFCEQNIDKKMARYFLSMKPNQSNVEKDKSLVYLKSIVDEGFHYAGYDYGILKYYRTGGYDDEMLEYIELAKNVNDRRAIYFLGEKVYIDKDMEKGLDMIKQASSMGYGPASFLLGNLYCVFKKEKLKRFNDTLKYVCGRIDFPDKDINKAIEYYDLAFVQSEYYFCCYSCNEYLYSQALIELGCDKRYADMLEKNRETDSGDTLSYGIEYYGCYRYNAVQKILRKRYYEYTHINCTKIVWDIYYTEASQKEIIKVFLFIKN